MGKTKQKSLKVSEKFLTELKRLVSDDTIEELRAKADELGDGFVAAAERAGLLELAVQEGAVGVRDLLLESGVNADARPGSSEGQSAKPTDKLYVVDHPGPLFLLATRTSMDESERGVWAERLLGAGASPATLHPDLRIINPAHRDKAYSALDAAVVTRAHDLVERFLPLCNDETRASAAVTALRATAEPLNVRWHAMGRPLERADVERLLQLGLPFAGVSRWGLPVAHAIALFASVELFELLAPRCSDLNEARIGAEPVVLGKVGVFFDRGGYGASLAPNETVTLGPGTSPRAAVSLLILAIERGIDHRRSHSELASIPALEKQIERLKAVGALLEANGDVGTGGELVVPEELRPLIDLFREWHGRDAVDAFARGQRLTGTTPFVLALRLGEAFAGPEVKRRLAHRPEHPVALLFDHERRSASPAPTTIREWKEMFGDTEHDPQEALLVDPAEYHEGGRELLWTGRLFAAEGGAVWGAGGSNGEVAIFSVSAERTVVHGSVNDLLRDFLG